MRRALPFALAVVSGVLYFEGFIGHGHFALSWICLAPVLFAVRDLSPKRTLAVGAVFGLTTHLGGYPWVVHLLEEFAGLSAPLAVLGYVLLCAAQGFSLAVFLWLTRLVAKRTGRPIGLVAPFVLTAVEAFYPLLFQSYLANSQQPFTLVTQVLDLGGPLLLTFVISLANGAVAEAAIALAERRRPGWKLPVAAAALFTSSLIYGGRQLSRWGSREAGAPTLRIGLAQSNVGAADNHLRWDEGWRRNQRLTRLLASEGAQLAVWAEGGFMGWIPTNAKTLPDIPGAPVAVLTGTSRFTNLQNSGREEFNGSVLIDKDGRVLGGYDKIDLLALGEYLPLGETFPIIYKWQTRFSGFSSHFTRGRSTAPIDFHGWRLGPSICFEDILADRVRSVSQGAPHVLVNMTNDSWYGRSSEQDEHLALASFRAIEERRWLARATNTGISAFIDAEGRIVERSGTFTEAALIRDVPMLQGGTFYLWAGDWPGWLAAALCAVEVARKWRRTRANEARANGAPAKAA